MHLKRAIKLGEIMESHSLSPIRHNNELMKILTLYNVLMQSALFSLDNARIN